VFPVGGAKSGQKTACNVEATNKEISVNPEPCNLGGKERRNTSHPIEFCGLLIQFWAFPVWELKYVMVSDLEITSLAWTGFLGYSRLLSYIPIAWIYLLLAFFFPYFILWENR